VQLVQKIKYNPHYMTASIIIIQKMLITF